MGFLTVGERFNDNINDILNDRIDVVTKGFLGLTVNCARCHDHKFDPIPTKDSPLFRLSRHFCQLSGRANGMNRIASGKI